MNFNDKDILLYKLKTSVLIYNKETNKAIAIKDKYINASPYLYQLFLELNARIGITEFDSLPKEDKSSFHKIMKEKTRINTIHEGLIEIKLIKDDIYNRFRNIVQNIYDSNQIEMLTQMINSTVLQNRRIKVVGKSLQNRPDIKNEAYFEEKYHYVAQLLEEGEWEISGFEYDENGTVCELGHPIKKVVFIEEKTMGYVMQFGTHCIEDVINLTSTQKTEIENMFSTYRRIIIEYTYMLESISASEVNIASLLERQKEVMMLLRGTISLDKSNSMHQYLRTNKRREQNVDSDITIQKYEYMISLLNNHIPLPWDYVKSLLDLTNKQTGFTEFKDNCRRFMPFYYPYLQYCYRCLLGQYTPAILNNDKNNVLKKSGGIALVENPVDILGYPLSKASFNKFKDNYDEFVYKKVVFDNSFYSALNNRLSITSVTDSVTEILEYLSLFGDASKGNLTYSNEYGVENTISIPRIIKDVVQLNNNMKIGTILTKYNEFKVTESIDDYLEQQLDIEEYSDSWGSNKKDVYSFKGTVSEKLKSGNLLNILSDINVNLQGLERFVLGEISGFELDSFVKKYNIKVYQSTGLGVLYNRVQEYVGNHTDLKPVKVKSDNPTVNELLTLVLLEGTVLTLTQGIQDEEFLLEIKKIIHKFLNEEIKNDKYLDEKMKEQKEAEELQKLYGGNVLYKDLMDSKTAIYAYRNYNHYFKDRTLSLKDEILRELLNIDNQLLKYCVYTMELDALETLIDNGSIILNPKESSSVKFIREKVYPFLNSSGRIISPKQAKYGIEDVDRILRERVLS